MLGKDSQVTLAIACRNSYEGDALNLASFRESSELEFGADDAFILAPDVNAGELAASTGLPLTEGAAYAVRGASGRAALHRLRPEGGADVTVAGAARWGTGDGLFVSLAIVYVDGSV